MLTKIPVSHWFPRVATILMILGLGSSTASAGIADSPLPVFSDAKPSVVVLTVPAVVDRAGTATVFLCSSVDSAPVNVGVQVFDAAGVLRNDVTAGQGAVLNLGYGATATIGTSLTEAFLESKVLTLPPGFSQGSARVVASSPRVLCNAMMLDDGLTPPVSLSTLGEGVHLRAGALPPTVPLPSFSNGNPAVASAMFAGAVSRGRLESAVVCTSLAAAPIDLGIQVLSVDGSVANDVFAGNGAVLAVAPGQTVTFATSGTKTLLEDTLISVFPLPLDQGAARVVATSTDVLCWAMTLDKFTVPPLPDAPPGPPSAMTELVGRGSAAVATQVTLSADLPIFADAKPSVVIETIPGVIKRGQLQTVFLCTSNSSVLVNVGVEIFSNAGVLLNDVGADVGAIRDIPPGATVTIATSATAAYLETAVIPLATRLQGVARIVASSADVTCTTVVIDDLVSPPAVASTFVPSVRPSAGVNPGTTALPTFPNGHAATHAAFFPGVVKRGDVETEFFCTSVAPGFIDIGVQVFTPSGSVANSISAGNGVLLRVAPGSTVSFGTTGTAALLENSVISLPNIAQGMARVVSNSGDLLCNAMMLDAFSNPPATATALRGFAAVCGNGVMEAGEQCDGVLDAACPGNCNGDCRCPALCGDGYVQAGETCDDGNAVSGDCCSSVCQIECDDGNTCTRDFCSAPSGVCTNDASPIGCFEAGKSSLQLKAGASASGNKFKWKWGSGAAVSLADLGSPDTTTDYSVCLYDSLAGVGSVATVFTLPPSPLWIAKSTRGWNYKDKAATSDGVSGLSLATGVAGRSKAQLKAGGVNFPMPAPVGASQYFNKQSTVSIQLLNQETGACWSSSFSSALVNDGVGFKAKAP